MKVGFKQKIFILYVLGLMVSVGLSGFSYFSQKGGMKSLSNYIEFQRRKDGWRDLERYYQGKMNAVTLGSLRKDAKWKEGFYEFSQKEESILKNMGSLESSELFNHIQRQKNYLLKDDKVSLFNSLKAERKIIVKKVQSLRNLSGEENKTLMTGIKGWLRLLTYYSLGMSLIFSLFLYLYKLNQKTGILLEKERKKRDFMLDSLDSAVILLDRNFNLISFNKKSKQIWRNQNINPGCNLKDILPSYNIRNEEGETESIKFEESDLLKNMNGPLVEKGFHIQISLPFQGLDPHWYQVEVKSFKGELTLLNFLNITNIIQANDLIQTQQKTLIEQSKMTALGQMSSGMAHEINNPLAIISSEAEELLEIAEDEGQVSQEDAASISKNIKVTTGRIAKIIKGLRIFARQTDANEKADTYVGEVIDEVLGMATEKFKTSGVKFEIHKPSNDLDVISMNEVQIIQVLVNLLNNAYDAVKEQKDRKIRFEWSVTPEAHLFIISDNGPGVLENQKTKIFDPFFTTKKVGHGTGLGLSLSKSIMEDHGGSLELLPSDDGAKFLVKLPKVIKLEEEEKWTA